MTKRKITLLIILLVLVGLLSVGWWEFLGKRMRDLPLATNTSNNNKNTTPHSNKPLISIQAKHLIVPWALDFLPGQRILLTQRGGDIYVINRDKPNTGGQRLARIDGVAAVGEGGLLGLAIHPDFKNNHYVYLYYTYRSKDRYFNKVVRYRLEKSSLNNPTILLDNIPSASTHNGGRMRFGPDGYLYITTGDAQTPANAQNLNSLAGKILRIKDDGGIPADNPFPGSPVYSYGHRNPQGIAWDANGQLWATEHGPVSHDEINRILPGENYGWPLIQGKKTRRGMNSPVLESGNDTWAPSGADIVKGVLYFAGLRGRTLYGYDLKSKRLNRYFSAQLGRLREVKLGPDQLLYITTNNRDGRGVPTTDDDLLLLVNPELLDLTSNNKMQ
ncbi:PQQ-dependent sugar dehydrogenase [Legionella spiritensis]|nr:PQQ-dependent sugar dehydrogenase [Legionella spiritensis]